MGMVARDDDELTRGLALRTFATEPELLGLARARVFDIDWPSASALTLNRNCDHAESVAPGKVRINLDGGTFLAHPRVQFALAATRPVARSSSLLCNGGLPHERPVG